MEDVTKALTMVAGVLIGIMILAILVSFFNKAGTFNAEYDSQLNEQAIEEFNSKFTAFERDNLTYFDIVSVANLAWDYNESCNWDAQSGINVVLKIGNKENYVVDKNKKSNKGYFSANCSNSQYKEKYFYNNSFINDNFYKDGKLILFTANLNYSNLTGKVNEIIFSKN